MSEEPRAPGCARCLGIGFVYETVNGREQVKPCACRAGAKADTRGSLEACRIPSRHRGATLGNFAPRSASQREAYARALAYCSGFPHSGVGTGLGLLFFGPAGSGKTHLAAGILMELVASKNISGRFWDFAALVTEISRAFDKSSGTAVMGPFRSAIDVELLLLDDLASKRIPDWAHNTLFEIVNARYMARRATLVTTAFDDVDAEDAAKADPLRRREFLVERIGQRVRSRLLEMCALVPMQEPVAREPKHRSFPPSTLAGMRRRGENG